jgi:dienelactone hydrolase
LDKPFPAYHGDEPYLFVCYAHTDRKSVYPEIRWLREQGFNIWYDEGITPGAEFPDYLGKRILDASLVLFYVGPNSVNSRHCRDEVYFALDHDTPLLALQLAPTELPPGLSLTIGTIQGLSRFEMPVREYQRTLVAAIGGILPSSGVARRTAVPSRSLRPWFRRRAVPLTAAAAVVAALAAGFAVKQSLDSQAEYRWVREEALPRIRALVDQEWRDYTEAYALAAKAEEIAPDDPDLLQIFEAISLDIDITSSPEGAAVYLKEYDRPDDEWLYLGATPLESVRVPVGTFRWKFEKEGFETVLATASSWDISLNGDDLLIPNHLSRKLDRSGEIPSGMVRVAGAQTPFGDVPDFFIDRYEVTNADFQKFVDAGGYRDRKYWRHEFTGEGRVLHREDGIAHFVDRTGRPGPASWLGGTYPDGQAMHPVAVSWYEAAAYAEFVGRSLPTGTHWGIARGEYSPLIRYPQLGGYAVFAPFSNFSSSGTVEVGSLPGVTAFGAYDLAGNVREWCWNDTSLGKLVRGGAWEDNPYRFAAFSQAPPMFRERAYGFRTVRYPDGEKAPEGAFAEVPINPPADPYDYEVVSDEVFEIFRRRYEYDHTDMNVRRESLDDSSELWTLERVSVDTVYGNDRMIINLFLPKNGASSHQAVIYFPGSASLFQTSSANIDEYYEFPTFLSFLVRNGRAVVYPVYQGTFERHGDEYPARHADHSSHAYSDYLVELVKDFRRTIDYLETREDIDTGKLAFYGMSWGATLGTIIPAVEERLSTAIILAGGVINAGRPEANSLNYVSRIKLPYLMLVGRYDSILGHEAAAKPLFDLLGTPDEHKVMKVYETDHIPSKSDYIAEILAWLDVYLGPVG